MLSLLHHLNLCLMSLCPVSVYGGILFWRWLTNSLSALILAVETSMSIKCSFVSSHKYSNSNSSIFSRAMSTVQSITAFNNVGTCWMSHFLESDCLCMSLKVSERADWCWQLLIHAKHRHRRWLLTHIPEFLLQWLLDVSFSRRWLPRCAPKS